MSNLPAAYILGVFLIIWVFGFITGFSMRRDETKDLRKEVNRNFHEMEMLREIIHHYETAPIRHARKLNK